MTETRTYYRDLTPGQWIWADGANPHPFEVRHVEPRPAEGKIVVVLAGGYFDVAYADDYAGMATDEQIADAKAFYARESIAAGLERLAAAYRDSQMPLPTYRTLALHELVDTEAALRDAATVLGVEVKAGRQPGKLSLEWASAPWSEDGARVTLAMRADADEAPAGVEGSSAGTAGPGEEPAAAPAGLEKPAGAALDATRVDHDTAALLDAVRIEGAVARGVASLLSTGIHMARAADGLAPEELTCACKQAPCGLIDGARLDPGCTHHNAAAVRNMRQVHPASQCPQRDRS